MLLFEKINTLETLFVEAKSDLGRLERELQKRAEGYVQAQVQLLKLEATESFSKALEQSLGQLTQGNQTQINELFSTKFDELASKVCEQLDLQTLSAQIAQDFASQNNQNLQSALELALTRSDIAQSLEALQEKAKQLVSDFESSLHQQLESLETRAQDTLQTLLEQNAAKLLANLDLTPLRDELEQQIAPQIDIAKIEQDTMQQGLKKLDTLIQSLCTQELTNTLERRATELARHMLQADEIVRDRYECALRLQSIKCFATEEIVCDLIAQSAKRQNYEDIMAEALKGADKKVYLSV